ncbi:MAG: hypothetical protein C4576_15345 [Desulfobacteraceae bacterium]|nr:MAG: hypothetical protein C4576_15345 [Desulfobacteraceae bacterium]
MSAAKPIKDVRWILPHSAPQWFLTIVPTLQRGNARFGRSGVHSGDAGAFLFFIPTPERGNDGNLPHQAANGSSGSRIRDFRDDARLTEKPSFQQSWG